MKHQTFEDAAQIDLSKPSLEALSFLLRHRELWPKGFEWGYGECVSCAMGLAVSLWSIYRKDSYGDTVRKALHVTEEKKEQFNDIFYFAGSRRGVNLIIPEMVADDIDAYLARSATFGQV